MIVYLLEWHERHEGCGVGTSEVFATKEAAIAAIASRNATGIPKLKAWKSAQHGDIENFVCAWSDGQRYVYLTEHAVQG